MEITKKLYKSSLSYFGFFFLLRNRKHWSGGWSFGKKVFWGAVGTITGKWFIYQVLRTYKIWNIEGHIISAIVPSYAAMQLVLIFYPKYSFLHFQPWEETQRLLDETKHSSSFEDLTTGNSMPVLSMLEGSVFFNVQWNHSNKAIFARAAGSSCKVLKTEGSFIFIQLPSKLIYTIGLRSSAIIGISAKNRLAAEYDIPFLKNAWKFIPWLEGFKTAGWARLLTGRIPKVRGFAMNPVDHPHGGRTKGGIHFWTPNGKLAWNIKTRLRKIWSKTWVFCIKNNALKQL